MPCSHLFIYHPLLFLPPIPPSIRVFSNESALRIRWPKYWSFSFSISPSKEHPGLISFEWTGWISLQSKGLSRVFSNTTVQKHQFFGAQLSSHPYVTTGKTIALTKWTFVSNLITFNCDHFLHKNYVSITYSIACYYQKSPSAPSQKKIISIYIFILRMGLPRWH